jgi:hypothetical protein
VTVNEWHTQSLHNVHHTCADRGGLIDVGWLSKCANLCADYRSCTHIGLRTPNNPSLRHGRPRCGSLGGRRLARSLHTAHTAHTSPHQLGNPPPCSGNLPVPIGQPSHTTHTPNFTFTHNLLNFYTTFTISCTCYTKNGSRPFVYRTHPHSPALARTHPHSPTLAHTHPHSPTLAHTRPHFRIHPYSFKIFEATSQATCFLDQSKYRKQGKKIT